MTWINLKQQVPPLYEKVILMVEADDSEKVLWDSTKLLYGWLDRVVEDGNESVYRFFDLKRYNTIKGKVTHWMSLPPEPEEV